MIHILMMLAMAAPMSEMTVFVGDLIAYADLVLGIAAAALNRQVRQAVGRAGELAWSGARAIMRLAGRARRTRPARKPRRKPSQDESEPVLALT